MVTVGVLALQGAVSEHVGAFTRAFRNLKTSGRVVAVKTKAELAECDALAIPGGESTTISRLLGKTGVFSEIRARAKKGMPILATCAGFVLLAKKGDSQVAKTKQKLLALMDFQVERNAFGRQIDSFESPVRLSFYREPVEGIFIRAPAVAKMWGKCKPVAWLSVEGLNQASAVAGFAKPNGSKLLAGKAAAGGSKENETAKNKGRQNKSETGKEKIVGVQQGNLVALAFHPELSGSTAVHEWFLEKFVLK